MAAMNTQTPISIHIPLELQRLAIPLHEFLRQYPKYEVLAVGAFIFTPVELDPSAQLRVLQVQRAATERSFPNLWEVPGGGADEKDPTILHSVAREIFEETGLHLTRFVREVGNGFEFKTGPRHRPKIWLKLTFEIEVAEIGSAILHNLPLLGSDEIRKGDGGMESSSQARKKLDSIPVILDPVEHKAHRWVSEQELREEGSYFVESGTQEDFDIDVKNTGNEAGALKLVSSDQMALTLLAFKLHKDGLEKVKRDVRKVAEATKEASHNS